MDREKVIRAIKCRAERNKRCGNPCEETGNCHYAKCVVGLDGEPYYPFVCDTEQLCTDALALLKEQEARLLSYEELDGQLPNETDIWCEAREIDRVFAMTTFEMWFNPAYKFRNGVNRKEIRFWTARPTEEQRRSVKWE